MTDQEPQGPLDDHKSAAYWRGRAEMAEAQAITGQPVPVSVADLIHERDELVGKNERLQKFANRMRYLAGPTSCECGTCWNLRHDVARLNDDLAQFDDSDGTDGDR